MFDFLFPDWAQASHLRSISEQGAARMRREGKAQFDERKAMQRDRGMERRVERLESDLAESALVIEALVEELESKGSMTREELAKRIEEIDARDGVVDGRATPESKQPFEPKRSWEDQN